MLRSAADIHLRGSRLEPCKSPGMWSFKAGCAGGQHSTEQLTSSKGLADLEQMQGLLPPQVTTSQGM